MASQKELKDNGFLVFSDFNDKKLLHLYKDIYDGASNTKSPYVATIRIENGAYVFMDNRYRSLDALMESVGEYHRTLMFPPWLYDAMYDKKYLIETQLYYYLVEKLGFVHSKKGFELDNRYVLSAGATEIEVSVERHDDEVAICYNYGQFAMRTPVSSTDEAMNTINAYIILKLSETFKSYVEIPKKLMIPDTKVPDTKGVKTNLSDFNVYEMRESLKSRLEEILKQF